MGGSLFEQLQKSGLVDEKKAKRARHEQQKEARQARHQRGKKAPPPDENAVAIEQARAHKAEKDRALNRQQKLAAEQKAVAAQIKQLVEMNRVDGSDGEIGFNFTDDN
ncbi:MAG: DUF2058 domain-containing protein, partial [Gammaproteobacteria bacterium]|nr:DUF2058 domain-containing protein [Gammaproteobacteria bacterium]